jgi:hypothetical protein
MLMAVARAIATIPAIVLLGCGGGIANEAVDADVAGDALTTTDASPDARGCAPEETSTYYADSDSDGYGTADLIAVDCSPPEGFVDNALDCNDFDVRDNPDGTELCDGIDNDCDPTTLEVCPTGCTPVLRNNDPYMFCNLDRSRANSIAICGLEDMHLVQIDSIEENTWVGGQRAATLGATRNIWLGGSDQVTEGSWVWESGDVFWLGVADGTPVDDRFSAWKLGQPNNSSNQDCGMMLEGAAPEWSDEGCGGDHRIACERNAPPPP